MTLFDTTKISGLVFIENYLTDTGHNDLLSTIDQQPWITDLKRRVQHYGYRYDYKARRINLEMKIGPLPDWSQIIGNRLFDEGIFNEMPDQLIINEYHPGQGITPHIDCEPCFEDTVVSITLGSGCVMDFANPITHEKIPVLLTPRSAVILKGDSRYIWTHGISPRKSDNYQGLIFKRDRRVSLTFRKTILN